MTSPFISPGQHLKSSSPFRLGGTNVLRQPIIHNMQILLSISINQINNSSIAQNIRNTNLKSATQRLVSIQLLVHALTLFTIANNRNFKLLESGQNITKDLQRLESVGLASAHSHPCFPFHTYLLAQHTITQHHCSGLPPKLQKTRVIFNLQLSQPKTPEFLRFHHLHPIHSMKFPSSFRITQNKRALNSLNLV